MTATADRRKATRTPSGSPVVTYYLLSSATGILVLLGLAVVLSSSSITSTFTSEDGNPWGAFTVQVIAMALGLVALVVGSRMPVMWWKAATPIVFYGSLVMLGLVQVVGTAVNGNKNWIRIAGFSLQPSEFAKLALALFLGLVLAQHRKDLITLKGMLMPGGIAAAAVIGLVLMGGDMGTAMVIAMVTAAAFWIAGAPARFFGMAALAAVPVVIWLLTQGSTRSDRISSWLSGETDTVGTGLQQTRGTWALASGGLWGLGPGNSREKWGYLPESENDFIYAIIGEEWGLIGAVTVLIAFFMILIAVTRLVHRHRDPFVQIASGAIGAWIVGQAFLNIAVVLELLPVFGVPLPLVSSGGSSMIASLAALGVLMAFARREPGAQEAFAARPSMIKRSIAVVSRGRRG